jgi:transcriptional regulator with XRE-family HTH domain
MAGTGARLRAIRRQWHLSLREVEERGDLSYQVSAGWLARLERGKHELTVNKLTALAEIYSIPLDHLLRAVYPRNAETQNPDQLSSPNATELPTEGLGEVLARRSLGAKPPLVGLSPDETTLVPSENGPSRTPYLGAIIGKLDLTLNPMIPAGSIVQIDTRKRDISPKEDWTHEFQRHIYFLKTRDAYVCGLGDEGQPLRVFIPYLHLRLGADDSW